MVDKFAKLSYEDAIRILDRLDPQRAEDYRIVLGAVDRLPNRFNTAYRFDACRAIRDVYRSGAIQDALDALAKQYLTQESNRQALMRPRNEKNATFRRR